MSKRFLNAQSAELKHDSATRYLYASRLSALCDGILEAGWLAMAVITPLFLNLYSSRNIETDKVEIAQWIAGVMAVAWLVKWIEQRTLPRAPAGITLRSPLVLPALFLVGAYVLATFTSIAPRISLFGAYPRPEGLYTILAYAVVFATILRTLRTRQQLNRLILTIILTSVPVVVYALIQHGGLDPLVWSSERISRVGSTMGNPIFLGAYLIMVFFLTVHKGLDEWRRAIETPALAVTAGASVAATKAQSQPSLASQPPLRSSGQALGGFVQSLVHAKRQLPCQGTLRRPWPTSRYLCAVGLTLIAALQMVALAFSASRGPFLGWLAGLMLFALLGAMLLRRQKWALGLIGLGLAGLSLLAAINIPNSPLAELRNVAGASRIVQLAATPGDSASARLLYWEGVARLLMPHQPFEFPGGTADALNSVRLLIGYGPDTLYLTFNRFYPPELARLASPETMIDRSHNETFDMFANTGIVGLLAYQLIFLSVLVYGFQQLRLICNRRERNLFAAAWLGLGLLGGLATVVLGKPEYLGIAIPAGNLTALFLYLALVALRMDRQRVEPVALGSDQMLIAALLAGILAHYVEIQFGIALATTRVLFWLFAGVVVVIGVRKLEPASSTSAVQSAAAWAWTSALMLSTLLFVFVSYVKDATEPLQIVWRALTFNSAQGVPSYIVLALLGVTGTLTAILVQSEMARSGISKNGRGLALFVLLSLGATVIFVAGLGIGLDGLTLGESARLENILTRSDRVVGLMDYYVMSSAALMALLAVVFMQGQKYARPVWLAQRLGFASIPIAIAALVWLNGFALNPIRADIFHKLGSEYEHNSQWDPALGLYQRALRLAPHEDFYFSAMGRALFGKARSVETGSNAPASRFNDQTRLDRILQYDAPQLIQLNRLDLLYAAQTMLRQARNLNPLYGDHSINLARFYLPELPVNSEARMRLANLSDQYYAEAVRLSPNRVALWNEWASFDREYRNDPDAALQKLNVSLRRLPRESQTYMLLGQVYVDKGELDQAIAAYQQALAWQPDLKEAQSKLAYTYYQQGKLAQAAQAYERYIEIVPNAPTLWEAQKNLAWLYLQMGDLARAIEKAQIAAALAPAETQTQLHELAAQWRRQAAAP